MVHRTYPPRNAKKHPGPSPKSPANHLNVPPPRKKKLETNTKKKHVFSWSRLGTYHRDAHQSNKNTNNLPVGGFKPFQKYVRQIVSFFQVGVKMKNISRFSFAGRLRRTQRCPVLASQRSMPEVKPHNGRDLNTEPLPRAPLNRSLIQRSIFSIR